MVDFHSHILPGIDDGSSSVEESIAMLHMEAEQRITHVIATPHFYAQHDTLERFLERRARSESVLRKEAAGYGGLPEITVGAEVYFYRGISESDFLSRLAIGGNRGILIEMPPAPWPEEYFRELESVRMKQGILPIIAHVDRYIGPFRTHNIPQILAELPVLVQANADFFLERKTASMAMKLLKEDKIQLIGSDCHNMSSRKPNLADALRRIERKLGKDVLTRIRGYEHSILDL